MDENARFVARIVDPTGIRYRAAFATVTDRDHRVAPVQVPCRGGPPCPPCHETDTTLVIRK